MFPFSRRGHGSNGDIPSFSPFPCSNEIPVRRNEFYFDKICISAQLGKVDKVYKLLIDYNEKDVSGKAFIFAILQEKDSMYHYLKKEDIDYWWVNGRFEFDPYRKEERYKAFLKKNYLPITHWNE